MANIGGTAVPFQSRKARVRQQTKLAVGQIMHAMAADHILLAEIIAGGPLLWRGVFLAETKGLAVNPDVADELYIFFCKLGEKIFVEEHGLKNAGEFLDRVEIPTPPTQQEIDDAWELDIASSEDAMSKMYEGGARHRKGLDMGEKLRALMPSLFAKPTEPHDE